MGELHDKEVKEVRTVQTDKEANELLSNGWTLLASGARHLGNTGYNAKTYFILAWTGKWRERKEV